MWSTAAGGPPDRSVQPAGRALLFSSRSLPVPSQVLTENSAPCLAVQRVLCGDRQEWARQGQRLGAKRHSAIFPRFEQRALHLCRRPIDFVGHDDVGEDRAALYDEGNLGGVVDEGAGDVRVEQVWRERMRWKDRPEASAAACATIVLASPGTPSSRTWPPVRSPMRRRWTVVSCPTTAFPTSALSDAANVAGAFVSIGVLIPGR